MNHSDFLRIVEILEANTRLCSSIIGTTALSQFSSSSRLRVDVEATNKLITELKDSITSKIEAQNDDREDSEQQTTIYTPSHTDSQNVSNHDTLDLDQIAEPSKDTPEQSSPAKVDVAAIQEALAPLLKDVASKDDVLALLKHHISQKDQITDFRDEARRVDGVNTKEATGFHKAVMSKIDALEEDLRSLRNNVATDDDILVLRADLAIQTNQEASYKCMKALKDQIAEMHGILGRFQLESGESTGSFRKDLDLILQTVSAIPSYDNVQVASIESKIDSLRNDVSDWKAQSKKPTVISPEEYASLKEDIVATVQENSAHQMSLLRDDVLRALHSSGVSDTTPDGTSVGSKEMLAREIPRVGQRTTTQSTNSQ